jgi:multidrug resistance protein MdtO
MDSVTALIALVAPIVFLSAWVAAGPRFSYVGLQIAFSFFIVAFEGLSAPTELAPARDRLIGILLALAVMWFVFDQIWPVRTLTVMRETFAAVLTAGATLLRLIGAPIPHDELLHKTESLRDRTGKNIAALRVLNDTVEYDFSVDRRQRSEISGTLLRAAITAAALFWNQIAILHDPREDDFVQDPELIALRQALAAHLDAMAASTIAGLPPAPAEVSALADTAALHHPRYREYVSNTLARFEELQNFAARINR